MYVENPVNHFCRDRGERNYFRKTCQELRTERALHHLKHLVVCRHLALSEGLEDKITPLLSDGLENVPPKGITDIVIAGMGGELIADILKKCQWIKSKANPINLVLQPMTKWDVLRKWLYENGFTVTKEKACEEGRFVYSVMQAVYTGEKPPYECDLRYLYCGLVTADYDDGALYIERQAARLSAAGKGMIKNPEKARLGEEMLELSKKLTENKKLLP